MNEANPSAFTGTIICQIGIVVKNVEKTARAWADLLGVAVPVPIMSAGLADAHTTFRGAPTEARAKLAFFHLGQLSLELIEPNGEPSTWKEFLDSKGEGVHHIAFMVKGIDGQIRMLADRNMPLVQKGDYPGGCYAYLESVPQLAVMLELLENH